MIENSHLHTMAYLGTGNVGLQIGKAKHAVGHKRQNLINLGGQKSTDLWFLKARFAHLRQSHPGGWQPLFEHELQQTLLAELDLRLQPVAGMVEALSQEVKQHP